MKIGHNAYKVVHLREKRRCGGFLYSRHISNFRFDQMRARLKEIINGTKTARGSLLESAVLLWKAEHLFDLASDSLLFYRVYWQS